MEQNTKKSGEKNERELLDKIDMVYVEGGKFMMGLEGHDRESDDQPVHEVTLSDFYIGKYPVTQALWEAVLGDRPAFFRHDDSDNKPVEFISWHKIQEFLQKLNRLTGKKYRLPTEAQWEYAARGGNKSKGYQYAGSDNINDVGWYEGNSKGHTQPVGHKAPNELGIYDMSGNVWEWCNDWYDKNYYQNSPSEDPKGPISGTRGVIRGGSWSYPEWISRVSFRNYSTQTNFPPDVGLRLALLP